MEPAPELLEPWLVPFLEGRPRADRARALLAAGERLGGGRAVCVWSGHGGRWRQLARSGERPLLPTLAQVRAVACGHLGAELPEGRTVVAAGTRWVVALGGCEVRSAATEGGLDLLEALLVAVSAVEEGDLADVPAAESDLEWIGCQPPAPLPSRGTHAPGEAPHAPELRALLQEIRSLEDVLLSKDLAPDQRRGLQARLDVACERVGDLLLGDGRGRGHAA